MSSSVRAGRPSRLVLLLVLGPVVLALLGLRGSAYGTAIAAPSESSVAADAYVSSSNASATYGSGTVLRTDAAPVMRSYLRFDLTGVTGPVTRATLRVYALDASTSGYTVSALPDTTWSEQALTYATAPAPGIRLGASGPHPAGAWTSVDVTSAVPASGTYGFVLSSASSKTVRYSSREGGFAAQLLVTTALTPTATPTSTPSPTPVLAPSSQAPTGPADLLGRTNLIYGTEIGAWRSDGRPAVDPSTGIPGRVQAARIPLVRFAQYDAFTDMLDPNGQPGTETRARFDAAIDGIRNNLRAEPFVKLLPIAPDLIGTKTGTIYCPAKNNLTSNLKYDKAIVAQAGPRVRLYESTNEMEYTCSSLWGFSSAGAAGVSALLGQHYAQNMPALKKYARGLGFDIATVGYVGVSGGTGWGNTITTPNTRSMSEFMTAVHDAYVASGNDPDYIPDAASIHAYPYSPDFSFSAPLSDIISYYDNWAAQNRQVINNIWGPVIGPKIKLAVSEWNAGNSSWPGFTDGRVSDFYRAWLQMLRRDGFWLADQFATASNDSSNHDIIREDGTTRPQYDAFAAVSTADPMNSTTPAVSPSPPAPASPAPTTAPAPSAGPTAAPLTLLGLTDGQVLGSTFTVQAVPAAGSTGVSRVEFWLDGALQRTESLAPYCYQGDDGSTCYAASSSALSAGAHVLLAKLYSAAGVSTSQVRVTK